MQFIENFFTLFRLINHSIQIKKEISILIKNYFGSVLILNMRLEFLKADGEA